MRQPESGTLQSKQSPAISEPVPELRRSTRLRAIPGVSGYSLAAASSTADANRVRAAGTAGPCFREQRHFSKKWPVVRKPSLISE